MTAVDDRGAFAVARSDVDDPEVPESVVRDGDAGRNDLLQAEASGQRASREIHELDDAVDGRGETEQPTELWRHRKPSSRSNVAKSAASSAGPRRSSTGFPSSSTSARDVLASRRMATASSIFR